MHDLPRCGSGTVLIFLKLSKLLLKLEYILHILRKKINTRDVT
jgi:hypothetical protein